ncbi:inositol monophosphatase family protein [Ruania albidiflava]|uniref:inositol monophosphatase family protein n=1 Tax=Ruania albidiflava TaxID=366586 RepID=UPI0003B3AA20|nr:inositol monophosphatase [Ruania albidiflava]
MSADAVLEIMKEAADTFVRPRFRALSADQVQEKSPGDLVTVADREAEVAIAASLRLSYPGALIVGEEACAGNQRALAGLAEAEHAFTIDPVDGTRSFVAGSPDYAMMVGELRLGRPVRSWIWLPEHGMAYLAEAGAGAWCDGVRIDPAPRPTEPGDLRGGSATAIQGTSPGGLAPVQAPPWSAGVAYTHIATGRLDYMLFGKDWPWDHVPGSLILTELGGRTGWLDGTDYHQRERPGWLLAAGTPDIFEITRVPLADARGARMSEPLDP